MIIKTEKCIYCYTKMESVTAKKKFCSDKCRIYFNREKGKPSVPIITLNEPLLDSVVKNKQALIPPFTQKEIPPMPIKEDYPDSLDFAEAKNEWKKMYLI